MLVRHVVFGLSLALAIPSVAFAQGTIGGAQEGVARGNEAAGPVGGVVGGAVGAATGTVGGVVGTVAGGRSPDGVLGVGKSACDTKTVRRETAAGTETVRRADCN